MTLSLVLDQDVNPIGQPLLPVGRTVPRIRLSHAAGSQRQPTPLVERKQPGGYEQVIGDQTPVWGKWNQRGRSLRRGRSAADLQHLPQDAANPQGVHRINVDPSQASLQNVVGRSRPETAKGYSSTSQQSEGLERASSGSGGWAAAQAWGSSITCRTVDCTSSRSRML
jgi:hypothetical protein